MIDFIFYGIICHLLSFLNRSKQKILACHIAALNIWFTFLMIWLLEYTDASHFVWYFSCYILTALTESILSHVLRATDSYVILPFIYCAACGVYLFALLALVIGIKPKTALCMQFLNYMQILVLLIRSDCVHAFVRKYNLGNSANRYLFKTLKDSKNLV